MLLSGAGNRPAPGQAAAAAPSPWVVRAAGWMRPGGRVLDLACGSGRHTRWLASRGFEVTAVDIDAEALSGLATVARTQVADLEGGPWPLAGETFDGVVVTNYLWRPLWPALRAALAPGGAWVHETFAAGQETVGRPRRPEFLLQPGELLEVARGLRIVAFEDGWLDDPGRFVQRIAAVREADVPEATLPARFPLEAPR